MIRFNYQTYLNYHHKNESWLIKITKINEENEREAMPPPFSILYFEIHTTSLSYNLGHDVNDPVTEIRVRYQEEPEISLEGSEDAILQSFCEYIQAKDPDILFSSNQHSGSTTALNYLFA